MYLMHACFIVLQLHSDSCQIHRYVMLCYTSNVAEINKYTSALLTVRLKCTLAA